MHDRVELSTLSESRLLIQTELEQVRRVQLARHELRAPIAGIVLSGGRASRQRQWTGSLWVRCVWLAWKLGLSR